MSAIKHPADGLYTFSAKRAEELGACSDHLDEWWRRHGEKVVPVTLADMTEQVQKAGTGAITWCLLKMRRGGLLTLEEYEDGMHQWWCASTPVQNARVLMDALLARAKREGRVS